MAEVYRSAHAAATRRAEVYRSAHAAAAGAAAENERGELLRRAGRPAEAAECFGRALAALDGVADPDPGTHSAILNNLALSAHERGELPLARRYLVRSLEVGPLVGDPVGRAITYDNLGVVEVELARLAGEVPAARPEEAACPDETAAHPDGTVADPDSADPDSPDGDLADPGRVAARGGAARFAAVHLREAEGHFAAAERLFRSVLPEALDDYLRSVLNRADAAGLRRDTGRVDRLTRHAAELARHHSVGAENALEAVTMRGDFLHRRRGRPRAAVELLTARLPALLPGCAAERSAAALAVLLRAAAATGDPALVDDVTARMTELGIPARSAESAGRR
ncbi:tetratricopeptide repeat protein [Actinoplanes oblitus]|uniref:Tetratricopeptide repeat protein n=1 Tax=Actinoplanes oblitus TaxID=3040509 RepID=A0ABY8WMX6_9ACTN|nr:tetratricopeptide repeat protein [Actinoplanes oblitus]WIM99190.1 tetratricopeptide repeat protein [Actinoplanes oblitus]